MSGFTIEKRDVFLISSFPNQKKRTIKRLQTVTKCHLERPTFNIRVGQPDWNFWTCKYWTFFLPQLNTILCLVTKCVVKQKLPTNSLKKAFAAKFSYSLRTAETSIRYFSVVKTLELLLLGRYRVSKFGIVISYLCETFSVTSRAIFCLSSFCEAEFALAWQQQVRVLSIQMFQ